MNTMSQTKKAVCTPKIGELVQEKIPINFYFSFYDCNFFFLFVENKLKTFKEVVIKQII